MRRHIVNVFFILLWALYIAGLILFFFVFKSEISGMTFFQDYVLNSWDGEWFLFFFTFGLFLIVGQALWLNFIVEPLTAIFRALLGCVDETLFDKYEDWLRYY